MKAITPALLTAILMTGGPAAAGCGSELNCEIATASLEERQPWLEKVEQSRRRSAAFVARAYSAYIEKNAPVAPLKVEQGGAPTDYLHDATLKKNDIVVTDEGFLVFKGGAGAARSYRDFMYMSHSLAEKEILKGSKTFRPEEKDARRRSRS
jgi:hypothetical protein